MNGKVLKTFEIKEKIIVAKKEKIEEVIVPIDNEADVEMLEEDLRSGIRFHYVSAFEEVYPIIFEARSS